MHVVMGSRHMVLVLGMLPAVLNEAGNACFSDMMSWALDVV